MDLSGSLLQNTFEDINDLFKAVYDGFYDDFVRSKVYFEGQVVGLVDIRLDEGKEVTFWHVVSSESESFKKGQKIKERNYDLKRARRIHWIKKIIEGDKDGSIRVFTNPGFREPRIHLWYKQEFVVVLVKKPTRPYYRLLTAFTTDRPNKIREFERLCNDFPYKKADAAVAASNPNKP